MWTMTFRRFAIVLCSLALNRERNNGSSRACAMSNPASLGRRPSRRRRLFILLASVVGAVAVFGFVKWREASNNGGQKAVEPFRIAGNLYYVGANDVTSFLITSPEGDVLIDGGYPGTAPMIMQSIAKLGFRITDVKSAPQFPRALRSRRGSGGFAEGIRRRAVDQRGRCRRRRESWRWGCEPRTTEIHLLYPRPQLPGTARQPSIRGRRQDPCRPDRAHRAH